MANIDALRDVLRAISNGSQKTSNGTDLNTALAAALSGQNLSATATLDFPSCATLVGADLTIDVPGAVVGNPVAVGTPAAPAASTGYVAFVSAADVVTVRFLNSSAGTVNPASGSFTVTVFK